MAISADQVAANLEGSRRTSSGWKACCPAHEDHNASLSIRDGHSGGLLLKCFAGCSYESIVGALQTRGLPIRSSTAYSNKVFSNRRQPEAVYKYVDERGALLFEKHRYPGKQFKIRRPNEWGIGNARRVLYRLPEILRAVQSGQTVCVVEGEKDADNCALAGIVATTNFDGAAGKWLAEYSEALKGAHVVVLPDNDEPGLTHARTVCDSLLGSAHTVKLVELPNLPPKGDISDWLAAGGSAERLLQIVSQASLYQPNTTSSAAATNTEKKALSDMQVAQLVKEQFGEGNLIQSMHSFWRWTGSGVWRQLDDRAVKQQIQRVLQHRSSKTKVESVTEVLKNEVYVDEHQFDRTEMVNCLNGELHMIDGHWQLKPHDRSHYSTSQIPTLFDENAKATRFEKFLFEEVFDGDSDDIEKATVVCEMLGYSITTSTVFERFIMLVGAGANGKSVLLNVVENLCGRKQTTSVSPGELTNRFQRAHLLGKLAHIVTELSEGKEMPDAELKAIVSGELITAEQKHRPPFDFHPYCTCWFGTNHLPHTRDFSEALFRRALIIEFNRQFFGENADKHLKDKLYAELSGILNLALKFYCSAMERGALTEPPSSVKAVASWRHEIDQVAQFVEERCITDPSSWIASAALYQGYRTWAEQAGIRLQVSRNTLTRRLARFGVKSHRGTNGQRELLGIELVEGLE